ncbi:uncharacterized protein [Macrobrachium rosenbergii]|uniref:uncharacterized protein isoform X2 n=1 Tax=Macrobrachium rosenbergii TaxID=79674 RepID=UPI0034D4E9B2
MSGELSDCDEFDLSSMHEKSFFDSLSENVLGGKHTPTLESHDEANRQILGQRVDTGLITDETPESNDQGVPQGDQPSCSRQSIFTLSYAGGNEINMKASEGERSLVDDPLDSSYVSCTSFDIDEPDGILSDVRSVMSRHRSESVASLEYYRTDNALQVTAREGLQSQHTPFTSRSVRQSRRLPFWLWFAIAKCLGIKLNVNDRPIFATVLYTLTFFTAIGYVLCNSWFTCYDIASDYTKTTIVDGTVGIFFSILFVSLGLYANKLAYRLFSHKKFLNMLRLHSKTILKMNASAVVFFLMSLFAVVNNISAFSNFKDKTCETGIRKFMEALEQDARIYEAKYMGLTHQTSVERPVLEEYTWLDEDYFEELQETGVHDLDSNASVLITPQGNRRDRSQGSATQSSGVGLEHGQNAPSSSGSGSSSDLRDTKDEASTTGTAASSRSSQQRVDEEGSVFAGTPDNQDESARLVPLMSNSEILFRYWKIQCRLRMSSLALQRWMVSVISLVVIWLTMNLVMWLTYDPSLLDLANFFLPLALLPLLSSAYAEVNVEGARLLKFICLIEERLQLIYVLQNSPLQMTVFGFTLSYSTITTAAFGILLAFASKVLIQEISVPPKS